MDIQIHDWHSRFFHDVMCRARHLSRTPHLAGGGILRARNFISQGIGKGGLSLILFFFFGFLDFAAGTGLTGNFAQAQTPTAIARVHGQYAGTAACAPCHKDKVISYQQTAHYLTSQLANKNSILGSFKEGTNELTFSILRPRRRTRAYISRWQRMTMASTRRL